MHIKAHASVAVVISRNWANLQGVRMFLRQHDNPESEIGGGDDSHVVLARMLDSEDPHGVWIELNTSSHEQDPTVKKLSLFIPWSQVLAIVAGEEFSPAIQDKAHKIGFGPVTNLS